MELPIQFEDKTWCCPRCWHKRGKYMPLDHTQSCLVSCGYQFPEWAVRKEDAVREAKKSIENGEFVTVEFKKDADPMDVTMETSSGDFYFKYWKIVI